MRKFYIENESGVRKSLNGENGIRLTDPEGLGYETDPEYSAVSKGFFQNTRDNTEVQGTIAGNLNFTQNAYSKYKCFVDWLAGAKKLTFIYSPDGNEYCRDVEVGFLTKAELGAAKWLTVPFQLLGLTPWYKKTPRRIGADSGSGGTMRYPFRYDSDLRYGTSGSSYTARFTVEGHLPCAIVYRYTGSAVNPDIRCYNADGDIIGEISITGTFTATDTIEISSVPGACGIRKITEGGTSTDLITAGMVDISKEIFPLIPPNEYCSIRIDADSALSGEAEVLIYSYYRSV